MDFKFNEVLLINALRTFHPFLSQNHYKLEYLGYNEPDGDSLSYKASRQNRAVNIGYVNGFDVLILRRQKWAILSDKRDVISLKTIKNRFPKYRDLPTEFDVENSATVFEAYLRLIEDELLPVIKGEEWISPL